VAAIAACALVPLWGYWYAVRHADLQLYVNDYALKSPTQSYGNPHGARLALRDASNRELAVARSVEPIGYILAVHPDGTIGDCQHLTQQGEYGNCYARYSRWAATWADQVRTADVAVGSCNLHAVPVAVEHSNKDWRLWWVPLRHIGGLPRQYFEFVVAIDSRACVVMTRHDPS
jgi:hypothetical protein